MNVYQFKAMGTGFLLEGFSEQDSKILEEKIRIHEQIFSRFISDSELSAFNKEPKRFKVESKEFLNCMTEALKLYQVTRGIFNPFMGHEIEQLGYFITFDKIKDEIVLENTPKLYDRSHLGIPFVIDYDTLTIEKKTNVKVDLGGFAKGWSAHNLKEWSIQNGYRSGLIDAGGDIEVWGNNPLGEPWVIGVSNPFDYETSDTLITLIKDASIATSSVMKRKWKSDKGTVNHHIIDPKTRRSSDSDIIQISIFSEHLGISEAFSKALLISGINGIVKFDCEILEYQIGIIAYTQSGELFTNDLLKKYIE